MPIWWPARRTARHCKTDDSHDGDVEPPKAGIARLNGRAEQPPVDLGYEQMAKWVEQYYPDRLYLHPRAVRALKSAVYQNPSMVYRCLILLAEDYYDYRMGRINRDTFYSATLRSIPA